MARFLLRSLARLLASRRIIQERFRRAVAVAGEDLVQRPSKRAGFSWSDLLWPRPSVNVERDNILLLYHDVLWSSLLTGVINTFLAVFLLRLGGSAVEVGLLTSLPSLGGAFLSLRAARYVHRHRRNLNIVIIPSLLFRLGYPFLAIVPLLPLAARTWSYVGIVAVSSIPTIISNIALTSQIGDVVSVDRRAHVLSVRNMLSGASATLAALVGGWVLSLLPFPGNYQFVFIGAFLLSLIGLYHRSHLTLPKAENGDEPVTASVPAFQVLRQPVFRHFCFGLTVYLAGLYLPTALFSLYLVRTLHASDSAVGIVGTVGSLAATLAYPVWGRLLGRGRLRRILPIAVGGWGLFPAFIGLSPDVLTYAVASVYGNLFGAGVTTSVTQALIEMGAPHERPTRIAIYNTLAGIAAVTLPLLGTVLYDTIGIHAALFLATALRLGGAALYATMPAWRADEV
jgi:MFS family permease